MLPPDPQSEPPNTLTFNRQQLDPRSESSNTHTFEGQAGAGPAEPEPKVCPKAGNPGLPTAPPAFGSPVIPGYVVLGEIARGGMGQVYAAIDLSLDREVAIKTLVGGWPVWPSG